MIKNSKLKYTLSIFLILTITFCFVGCSASNTSKKYEAYLKSLINANYTGDADDYIKSNGTNEADAKKLLTSNASRLANSLINYYGIETSNNDSIKDDMIDIAKTIYSKVKFTVGKTYEQDGNYYIDIRISPINIFSQTNTDVAAYIDNMNNRIAAGDFNNYEKGDYEKEYATGIIAILENASANVTYSDPVVVTVQILQTEKSFSISDEDFIAIDSAIISMNGVDFNPAATTTDAAVDN